MKKIDIFLLGGLLVFILGIIFNSILLFLIGLGTFIISLSIVFHLFDTPDTDNGDSDSDSDSE
jgi:hypothetical protein